MSKKVSIMEGQASKHFGKTVKLQTKLRSEGYCFWVPKDESKLVTKRITKNGTYYAKNEKDINKMPYYGFSKVTVAVSNKIQGKKRENPPAPSPYSGDWNYPQDGDGRNYGIDIDDNGNIIEDIIPTIPAAIHIKTNPNKTTYNIGDTIDYTGIVVSVVDAQGDEIRELDFNELIFSKRTIDGSTLLPIRGIGIKEITNDHKYFIGSHAEWEQGLPFPIIVYAYATDDGQPTTVDTIYLVEYGGTVWLGRSPAPRYEGDYLSGQINLCCDNQQMFTIAHSGFITTRVGQDNVNDALKAYATPINFNPEGIAPNSIYQIPVQWKYNDQTFVAFFVIKVNQ